MPSGFTSTGELRAEAGAHSQTTFGVESPRKEFSGSQALGEAREGCLIHGSEFKLCWV